MSHKRTIAACCSGGDASGMNPWLRAVTRLGLNRHEAMVLGIKEGYAGLVRTANRVSAGEQTVEDVRQAAREFSGKLGLHRREQDLVQLDHAAVCGLTRRGGAVLKAGRCRAFHDAVVRSRAADLLRGVGVDALFVCGGNGSLAGAERLARESGCQVIVVPATIDNDVGATEIALGVDTAVNSVVWAVERFCDTAASHGRIMVLEIMGRESGNLARLAAVASGAEIVVTPERNLLTADKMLAIAERLEHSLERGREHGIVLVAEGVKLADGPGNPTVALAGFLQDHFRRESSPFPDLETRASILGHLQRGGSPTATDRILAARFAEVAWQAVVADSSRSGLVGIRHGQVVFQEFDNLPSKGDDEPWTGLYQLQKDLSKW